MELNYLSRTQANSAQKLPIENGEKGDYYLEVVSIYSDKYRFNKSRVLQEMAESVVTNSNIDDETHSKHHAALCACCVVGWELPKEFGEYSSDSARNLLFQYPQLADAVDSFFSADHNFKKKLTT